MSKLRILKSFLIGGASVIAASHANADAFDIPGGDLQSALAVYSSRTGVELLYLDKQLEGVRTRGAKGELTAAVALSHILAGTGFTMKQEASAVTIVRDTPNVPAARLAQSAPVRIAAASSAGIESVVVTSSKIKGDIQTVPIAITALSQEQLTARQIAGGPDLVKEVPNLTFTKTNFTGYSIQIRGIGTQAVSVTTDPAVAVALNDIPFIRNHFFEQEFYDVNQVEVLRGPQGTLYGRNATAGVVNLITAKPTDQFEMMLSADGGNFNNRRFEGMINIPIMDDRVDLRIAGEWTRRDGYSFNSLTNAPIDGRNLWSGRISLVVRPLAELEVNVVWEHFAESDDRLRSSKQLCKKDPIPTELAGYPIPAATGTYQSAAAYLNQGCRPVSLYSSEAYEVPNGFSLPFILGLDNLVNNSVDPYASKTQSRDLRVIESALTPIYSAKNDVVELNTTYQVSPEFSLTSQTAFGQDFLYSAEDYNRFNTTPGIWSFDANNIRPNIINDKGEFCDPQLGCSSRLVGEDLSEERAWQLSQEFRIESKFSGPFNFSAGGNYLHYETDENYYVFINALTLLVNYPRSVPLGGLSPWVPNVTDNSEYLHGHQRPDPFATFEPVLPYNQYIDPHPLASIDGQGHNYFRSDNPYSLNSYAFFGEATYNIKPDLQFTTGLRWTEDRKSFIKIPSEVLIHYYGYPSTGTIEQKWDKLTGRGVLNWTPKFDFTDQTLLYASYAHGYKAGGANPPAAILPTAVAGDVPNPLHPLTFKPEFIDAFEAGTKNTLLDGALTLNASAFYYDYKDYQVSEIVDRTAINLNFDATVKGGEIEATWEPSPGLRFNFAGGWEDSALAKGSHSIDLMDRTAGHNDWIVLKPFPSQASNCIAPDYLALAAIQIGSTSGQYTQTSLICGVAYASHQDPISLQQYTAFPVPSLPNYPGFDPLAGTPGDPYTGQNTFNGHDYGPVPNNGVGFDKNLSGNQLPNAPPFTLSAGTEYSMPLSENWVGTLHGDFYWQSNSYWRVFSDLPYDKLKGYTNVNLALMLTSANGLQVMLYGKNIFDTTAITGAFLNSDDSALTTNVFLTDPRLFGIRVTKNW